MSHSEIRQATEAAGCDTFEAATRLVVAPEPGSFEPTDLMADRSEPMAIARGQVLGHVTGTSGRIEVISPFAGYLDTVFAWPNERLQKYQRVVSMWEAS